MCSGARLLKSVYLSTVVVTKFSYCRNVRLHLQPRSYLSLHPPTSFEPRASLLLLWIPPRSPRLCLTVKFSFHLAPVMPADASSADNSFRQSCVNAFSSASCLVMVFLFVLCPFSPVSIYTGFVFDLPINILCSSSSLYVRPCSCLPRA